MPRLGRYCLQWRGCPHCLLLEPGLNDTNVNWATSNVHSSVMNYRHVWRPLISIISIDKQHQVESNTHYPVAKRAPLEGLDKQAYPRFGKAEIHQYWANIVGCIRQWKAIVYSNQAVTYEGLVLPMSHFMARPTGWSTYCACAIGTASSRKVTAEYSVLRNYSKCTGLKGLMIWCSTTVMHVELTRSKWRFYEPIMFWKWPPTTSLMKLSRNIVLSQAFCQASWLIAVLQS